MTPGIGYALIALAGFGAGDILYKRAATHGVESRAFIMLQSWVYCPAITLFAWATGTLAPHASALWGGAAGFLSLIAFYNFARSLHGGSVSTNAPIFRLNFALTAVLAIAFLGEPLTLPKLAALAAALMAVWLLLAEPGAAARPSPASLIRVLVATLAMALANFVYKIGLRDGALPETMVAAQAWVFSSTATLFAFLPQRRLAWTPGTWRYSTPASLFLLVAAVALMHGLALGPASVLVPVGQMGFVFAALFGTLVLREPLTPRKRIGLAIAVAALVLFAVS